MAHVCEHCDRTATNHEVEVTGGRKVAHHLCDEHAKERVRLVSDRYVGATEISWGEWLQREWARFCDRPGVEWPVRVRFPVRMVPDAPTACAICGEPATDREFEFALDGALLRDESRCVAHGGRPIEATRCSAPSTMNRWPVNCERCSSVATIHINTSEGGRRTTHHYCREHAI